MTDDLMEELRIMANEHDDELCRYALSRFVLLEEAIDHYRKALSQSSSRIEALEARNKLLEQSQAAQALAGLGVNVVAAHNSGLAALKAGCKEERLRAKKAEARIEALESLFPAILEYLENQADVVDGENGIPAPNIAMSLLVWTKHALEGKDD